MACEAQKGTDAYFVKDCQTPWSVWSVHCNEANYSMVNHFREQYERFFTTLQMLICDSSNNPRYLCKQNENMLYINQQENTWISKTYLLTIGLLLGKIQWHR